jgi:hypothetical protein
MKCQTRLGAIAICRGDLQTLMMELDNLFLGCTCAFSTEDHYTALANLQHRIELSAYGGNPSRVCARYYSTTQKSQPTKSNDTVARHIFHRFSQGNGTRDISKCRVKSSNVLV